MGSFEEAEKLKPMLGNASDYLGQVTRVNHLLQGICSRIDNQELSKSEAEGLFDILEWQNEKIENARRLIERVNDGNFKN